MSDYKEILTSDRVYKKYKSIIPDTNVSIDDIIQKLSYFYKISYTYLNILYQHQYVKLYQVNKNIHLYLNC
mgnify:CR=1 FL=1